jgi:hypothetical protein
MGPCQRVQDQSAVSGNLLQMRQPELIRSRYWRAAPPRLGRHCPLAPTPLTISRACCSAAACPGGFASPSARLGALLVGPRGRTVYARGIIVGVLRHVLLLRVTGKFGVEAALLECSPAQPILTRVSDTSRGAARRLHPTSGLGQHPTSGLLPVGQRSLRTPTRRQASGR